MPHPTARELILRRGTSSYDQGARPTARELILRYRAIALDKVEAAIAGRSFLVGDALTGADIMMGFTLWSARMLKLLSTRHPETLRYFGELKARPAFAKALAEGR